MKRLSVFLALLLAVTALNAQQDTTKVPMYQRFPTVPPFKLLLADSVTYYSKDDLPKKKKVLVMQFSPDCDHCKHQTEQIIANIKDLEDVQIVMSTTLPLEKLKEFYQRYELSRFDNIVAGKDANYLLPTFYEGHSLPFLAFYNKKKELISVFEGKMPVKKLLAELDK